MPDISMCMGENCASNYECYRFRAKPSEYRQAYMLFKAKSKQECNYFIPLYTRKPAPNEDDFNDVTEP